MADDQTTVDDECGICLMTLKAAVTLPCTHKFCADCLDGWKSKFGAPRFEDDMIQEERSKSCSLCRKRIPPSKDMMIQLEFHRTYVHKLEAIGDTTSESYMTHVRHLKRLEAEIGDYEGKGLDYDGYIELLPGYIFEAVIKNDIESVMDWLGSPVDKKKLSARYPDHLNSTLVHAVICNTRTDLLSILLQYGADVNALDAKGYKPLMFATKLIRFEQAKILLEWGAEISLPNNTEKVVHEECGVSVRDAFIQTCSMRGNNKLANLLSSEFGGRRCEVINLPNHPQLNGKACVVEKYNTKKDRYKVIFEGSGNAALVGPNNLKRRDRTPLDCGYYISFKNGRISRRDFAIKEECREYVASLGGDVKETAEELESLKL